MHRIGVTRQSMVVPPWQTIKNNNNELIIK